MGAKTILIEKFGHDMASGIRDTLARCEIRVVPAGGDRVFFINVTVMAGDHAACCEIVELIVIEDDDVGELGVLVGDVQARAGLF